MTIVESTLPFIAPVFLLYQGEYGPTILVTQLDSLVNLSHMPIVCYVVVPTYIFL